MEPEIASKWLQADAHEAPELENQLFSSKLDETWQNRLRLIV